MLSLAQLEKRRGCFIWGSLSGHSCIICFIILCFNCGDHIRGGFIFMVLIICGHIDKRKAMQISPPNINIQMGNYAQVIKEMFSLTYIYGLSCLAIK